MADLRDASTDQGHGGNETAQSPAPESGSDSGNLVKAGTTSSGGASEIVEESVGSLTAPAGSDDDNRSGVEAPPILSRNSSPPVADDNQRVSDRAELNEWRDAIEKKDSLSLLKILNAQKDDASRLSLCDEVRGEGGRTALHVAAMQGCFRLAKRVIDLIPYENTPNKKVEYRVYYTLMKAKDGRSGLTAYEMANYIIGNTSISQYVQYKRMRQWDRECYGGMYEAYEGTEWRTALAQGDCEMLRTLLQLNSRLLLETCGGLTVLDVAILKKHKELVEVVVRAFGPARDKVSWSAESHFPSELTWDWIGKGHFGGWGEDKFPRNAFHEGATQERFAELGLTGADSISIATQVRSVKSALDLACKVGSSEGIKGLLGEGDRPAEPVARGDGVSVACFLESQLPDYDFLCFLAEIIDGGWQSDWDAGYEADVDYNFQERGTLRSRILRFHYACKDPRSYWRLHRWIWYERLNQPSKGNPALNINCLDRIWDGQGRTPFHVLVDHHKTKFSGYYMSCLGDMIPGTDSRGRSPLVRAFTKHLLDLNSRVLYDILELYDDKGHDLPNLGVGKSASEKLQDLNFWLFYVILFHSNEYDQRSIITFYQASDLETLLDEVQFPIFGSGGFQTKTLLLIAAIGLQPALQLCLQKNFNLMVEDEIGKTALRYAADPNLIQFCKPPLHFYCSVDYMVKCFIENNWIHQHRGKIHLNMNSNGQQNTMESTNRSDIGVMDRRARVLMLLEAGAQLSEGDRTGDMADRNTSTELLSFQDWWYGLLLNDLLEKKNGFNTAGSATSVVATVVATTSYIGPLQPPLNYDNVSGYIETSKSLVKVFMVSNTLAFYLAMASVMFAVMPSLPMPPGRVIVQLKHSENVIATALVLLLVAIGCILVSFAAAAAVVVDNDHYYGWRDFLLWPSILGWIVCLLAMGIFWIRVLKLVYSRNSSIRKMSRSLKKLKNPIPYVVYIFMVPIMVCRRVLFRDIRKPYNDMR